ncbi:MAG TPA: hypothetical protein VLI04_06625 [Nocardioidaceae bacterium]|nr:hypothetical protein [Nocardioidaceae bacterium]
MLRRVLVLLAVTLALAGCGDDDPVTTERAVPGDTVVKRIEAAMREAATGQAKRHDGSADYFWDLREPVRVLVLNYGGRREARRFGDTVYERAVGGFWFRYTSKDKTTLVPELNYFKGREVTEVSRGAEVLQYVVKVPARVLEGGFEGPDDLNEVEVTIFMNEDGLPTRTRVQGDGLAGESFSKWGEPVSITRPEKSVKAD